MQKNQDGRRSGDEAEEDRNHGKSGEKHKGSVSSGGNIRPHLLQMEERVRRAQYRSGKRAKEAERRECPAEESSGGFNIG